MDLLTWFIIALLIAVNALYVAAEFGAVGASRSRIQSEAERGNGLAQRLLPIVNDGHQLDRYIACCQIGITVSSLVLGAYGQATLAEALTPWVERLGAMEIDAAEAAAALVVLVVLTVLQMILGELVPKSIALQYTTRTALLTVIPMEWSIKLLRWFIAVLNGSGNLILRLFRVAPGSHRHIHSPGEIGLLIAESREGGLLEPDEHRRLHSALNFSARPTRELMTPRNEIEALDVDKPYAEAVRAVVGSPYTRFPVYEGTLDNVIGIVHSRDIALAMQQPGRPFSLRTQLQPILKVSEDLPGDELLKQMRTERRQMAVVMAESGATVGIVTAGDVLDEILGPFSDEFKTAPAHG